MHDVEVGYDTNTKTVLQDFSLSFWFNIPGLMKWLFQFFLSKFIALIKFPLTVWWTPKTVLWLVGRYWLPVVDFATGTCKSCHCHINIYKLLMLSVSLITFIVIVHCVWLLFYCILTVLVAIGFFHFHWMLCYITCVI